MGVLTEKNVKAPSTQEIIRLLEEAESLFWSNLEIVARRGKVYQVRESSLYLAYIRALQASVGRDGVDVSQVVANILGMKLILR
jgi:separase